MGGGKFTLARLSPKSAEVTDLREFTRHNGMENKFLPRNLENQRSRYQPMLLRIPVNT